ncbi:uncharacterized protein LOC127750935 [Frankliniella occidentalis]|uniref:Uncharacterized protein LOC127750935 n=1 Tax=Frankliniella occidentalis TaxID=133901 RepID=A0A9C6X5Y8_FRAOC|nr:uncharacterized protein LOC127750935 [Frankliniella occidentalis]
MGSEFASQSTGQLALTPATFDATSQPSTSYEHEELIFSDTLQHTDNTRTVGLEESVFRTTCPTYHTINVSHSEEFHQAMAQEVPAASGQDSTIISKDTHNLFSALFPSYSRYRHGGFGGIGSEDSQYVPRMRNRLAGLPMPASAGARLSSTALGRARGDSATAHGRETEGEGGNSRRRQSASRLTKSMSWGVQDPRYNI